MVILFLNTDTKFSILLYRGLLNCCFNSQQGGGLRGLRGIQKLWTKIHTANIIGVNDSSVRTTWDRASNAICSCKVNSTSCTFNKMQIVASIVTSSGQKARPCAASVVLEDGRQDLTETRLPEQQLSCGRSCLPKLTSLPAASWHEWQLEPPHNRTKLQLIITNFQNQITPCYYSN